LNLDRKQIIFFEAHGQQIGFITLQDLWLSWATNCRKKEASAINQTS
jgi:hypothetical protein